MLKGPPRYLAKAKEVVVGDAILVAKLVAKLVAIN
jgi:hypothetical protein